MTCEHKALRYPNRLPRDGRTCKCGYVYKANPEVHALSESELYDIRGVLEIISVVAEVEEANLVASSPDATKEQKRDAAKIRRDGVQRVLALYALHTLDGREQEVCNLIKRVSHA